MSSAGMPNRIELVQMGPYRSRHPAPMNQPPIRASAPPKVHSLCSCAEHASAYPTLDTVSRARTICSGDATEQVGAGSPEAIEGLGGGRSHDPMQSRAAMSPGLCRATRRSNIRLLAH